MRPNGGSPPHLIHTYPRHRREDPHARRSCHRKTELVGSSTSSLSDAIETAIARAAKTLRHVEWFEVNEIRGHVRDGKVDHYQVVLKVGFGVDE